MRDAIPTKKRLSATVYYLLTGLCLGWPSLASLGVLLPDWRRGEVIFPLSLAAIHLFILGSMLTVAFGVLFQVIPIAFQAPPIPRHLLCWHLPIHVASVTSMTAGFITSSFTIVAVGGAILFANTTLYFAFIGHHYVRARNKTLVHRILSLPVSVLWFVMLLGLFQATFPNKVFPGVLLTHIILGGLAFWGGLVMVLSYKLVPMFVISHGCRVSLAGTASFYYSGVLLWIVSTWYSVGNTAYVLRDVGTAALLIGLICYTRDMLRIVIARKKEELPSPYMKPWLQWHCVSWVNWALRCQPLFPYIHCCLSPSTFSALADSWLSCTHICRKSSPFYGLNIDSANAQKGRLRLSSMIWCRGERP